MKFRAVVVVSINAVVDHALEDLNEWSKKWLMCFYHINKTEIIILSNTEIAYHYISLASKSYI